MMSDYCYYGRRHFLIRDPDLLPLAFRLCFLRHILHAVNRQIDPPFEQGILDLFHKERRTGLEFCMLGQILPDSSGRVIGAKDLGRQPWQDGAKVRIDIAAVDVREELRQVARRVASVSIPAALGRPGRAD